jgi:hypothetical protein
MPLPKRLPTLQHSIRIPRWTPAERVELALETATIERVMLGDYVFVGREGIRQVSPDTPLIPTHALPVRGMVESGLISFS